MSIIYQQNLAIISASLFYRQILNQLPVLRIFGDKTIFQPNPKPTASLQPKYDINKIIKNKTFPYIPTKKK